MTAGSTDRFDGEVAGTRFHVAWVAETGSTNDDALALARAGAPEGLVVVADHQTAGRGRLDRRWEAPPGSSLLCSVLLRPDPEAVPLARAHLCTKAVALAAAAAANAAADAGAVLKWPNDLVVPYAGGVRKLGGILAESVVEGDQLTAVVVGLGLNVDWPDDVPAELAEIMASLHWFGDGLPIARRPLLEALLRALEPVYASLLADGGTALLAGYAAACATIGQEVRVERASDVLRGRATGLTADGHLLVVDAGGVQHEVVVGDVVHLRPQ